MERKVKTNFIYNATYHIFLIIVPLITTPYVSRRLGVTGVGDYAFAYSIAYYFSLFIKLGLNNYGNRAIAYVRDDKERMSSEFWNIYCFQFILAVVVCVAYLFYVFLFAANTKISLYLLLFIISSGIDITWFFWGLEEFKITVITSSAMKILSTLAIFVFVKNENDTGIYTLILSLNFFGAQLFLWPQLFKHISFVKPTYVEVIKHIKPNLVLFLPAIAVSLYKIMDKIMLGLISNNNEVGYYESSEKIINIPMAIIESLGAVMQPRVSNLVSNKADEGYLNILLGKSMMIMVFFSSLIGFGIMSISNEFVPLFYGKGFDKCIVLFQILLPSSIFLSVTNIIKSQYLLPRKKDKQYIIALFTGAAVNLIINSILIPINASIGAAIGTLLAEMSVCIAIAVIAGKEITLSSMIKEVIPFVLSGIMMYVASCYIHIVLPNDILSIVVKAFLCGLIYFASLIFFILICDNCFNMRIMHKIKSIIFSK